MKKHQRDYASEEVPEASYRYSKDIYSSKPQTILTIDQFQVQQFYNAASIVEGEIQQLTSADLIQMELLL